MSAGIASADSDDDDAGDPEGDREESSDTDTDDGVENDDNSADGIDMSNTDDESDSNEGQAPEESINTEEEPETNEADDDSGTSVDEPVNNDPDTDDDESDNDSDADDDESAGEESSTNDNGSDDDRAASDESGDEPDTFESEPDNDDSGTEDDASDDEPGIDDPASKDDASESHSSQNTGDQKDAESVDDEKDQKASGPDTDEARDIKEKQTDESTGDKSNDESDPDAGENLSPSPPVPDKDKDTDAEKSDQKSYDRVSKDNYNKPYTADRDDPAPDTGSGSPGSTTGDSGTATADSRSDNNRTISKNDAKDIEDIISSDPGSPGSTESSSDISSTNAEDAAFLNEFRDSKEAPDNIEITDYSFASLVKGREVVFEFGLENNNVISVSFIPEVTGGQVKTVVEILRNTSTLINEAPPGVVYKDLNIWVGDAQFSPYKATDAKVNFKVEKDWILSNSIDPENIVLYGHVNGWHPLVTEKTGEDDAYVYYTAQTSRFSLFAIVSTDTYDLAEDPATGVTSSGIIGKSGIFGGSDAKGDTGEVPYYNTYMSAAILLVSLFVAGAAGIAGLKYITRSEISGNRDEQDSMQFKE